MRNFWIVLSLLALSHTPLCAKSPTKIIPYPELGKADEVDVASGKVVRSIEISGFVKDRPLKIISNDLGQILFVQSLPHLTKVWFFDGKQAKSLRSASIRSEAKQPLTMALDQKGQYLYWLENIDTIGKVERELTGQVDSEGYAVIESIPTVARSFVVSRSDLAGKTMVALFRHNFLICECQATGCHNCPEGQLISEDQRIDQQITIQLGTSAPQSILIKP